MEMKKTINNRKTIVSPKRSTRTYSLYLNNGDYWEYDAFRREFGETVDEMTTCILRKTGKEKTIIEVRIRLHCAGAYL